jgi:hypothetical protein
MSSRTAIAAGALVLALAGSACGSNGPAVGATSTSPAAPSLGPRPSSTAELSIVAPRDGQVIDGDAVDLRIRLRKAKVVAATSTDLRPDEGHLHVILDDQLISMTSGHEQKIPDVAPGQHLLKVEFVASDHAPFDPRVIAAVAFRVTSP